MKLRHKREPKNDGRARCAWCQSLIKSFANIRKYCPKCSAWTASGWRAAIIERDEGFCIYCGSFADNPHIDHIFPYSRGGDDTVGNLVTTCHHCNCSKRDDILDLKLEERVRKEVKKRNKKHKIPNDMTFPANLRRRGR